MASILVVGMILASRLIDQIKIDFMWSHIPQEGKDEIVALRKKIDSDKNSAT